MPGMVPHETVKTTLACEERNERCLNRIDHPKIFILPRTSISSGGSREETVPEPEKQYVVPATFQVDISLLRQSSLRGTVTWLEGATKQSFHSVLELVLLMDKALRNHQ